MNNLGHQSLWIVMRKVFAIRLIAVARFATALVGF